MSAAIIVAAVWWLLLGGLAVFTANPITLNRSQIFNAHYVITGSVKDVEKGVVVADKEWKRGANLGTIPITNLKEAHATAGQKYLIPISRATENTFRVTQSPLSKDPFLIYPSTLEAEQQLSIILEELGIPSNPELK